MHNQELFNYMMDQHNVMLLLSDMHEIETLCNHNDSDLVKFAAWLTGHDEATINQLYNDFRNKPPNNKPNAILRTT